MRDIRSIRFEKTADSPVEGENQNLLPLESHLPAFYQALRQRGQVSQEGLYAILRDLSNRVDALEGEENQAQGPAPSQTEEEHTGD